MRKFKLIKQYPASPKLGFIVFERHCGMYHNIETGNMYGSQIIENQPEYWEEVIENDYEILISRVVPQEILSVKRLSDGEVFTVGDRAMTQGSRGGHNIRQFRIRQRCTGTDVNGDYTYDGIDRIWIDWEEGCGGNWLESTVKLKQPIFITHDGKDIFEGDTVWWVRKESYSYSCFEAYSGIKFHSNLNAYFLTEEAASDYINRNKVLFTTEDGVGIKKGDKYYFVDTNLKMSLAPNASAGCGLYDERKYFSTYETAQYYIIVNAKVLSIEEFWEFVCKPGSNIAKQKALKRLVKKRLNIE
jgi:hypothetical protein